MIIIHYSAISQIIESKSKQMTSIKFNTKNRIIFQKYLLLHDSISRSKINRYLTISEEKIIDNIAFSYYANKKSWAAV